MSTAAKVWTGLTLAYAFFFGWYTSFGGPLTPEEIEHYAALLPSDGEPQRVAAWRSFMETDTGDDFVMLNAIDVRDVPQQVEGVQPGDSSEDVMNRYSAPFLGKAMRSAAHPVVFGWAAAAPLDIWGIEGADDWKQGGLIRYRSRRDLMKQVEWARGLDENIHAFKIAALEKTIAYPLDPWFQLGDPRLVLGLTLTVVGLGVHLRLATRLSRVPHGDRAPLNESPE
jgi:hypothetical protein